VTCSSLTPVKGDATFAGVAEPLGNPAWSGKRAFAPWQNRPGGAREDGPRADLESEPSVRRAPDRGRGTLPCAWDAVELGEACRLRDARPSPRAGMRPCIPASLPPARCAGRGQGSRSDGRVRLALTPPRTPGMHGLRRRHPHHRRACACSQGNATSNKPQRRCVVAGLLDSRQRLLRMLHVPKA
jgi:hypothetical protein